MNPRTQNRLSWMRIAAGTQPAPEWAGDLSDDCTARWAGFTLRAERMDERDWWWKVSLDAPGTEIASSHDFDATVTSGEDARAAATRSAHSFLFPNETNVA